MGDEFEPITESGPLVAELRERIATAGRVTFRDFMEAALYHPRFGYYSTHGEAMTRGGDYVTSPEVHPVFGALVAKQIIEIWDALGRPGRFDVIELGGGGGLLARDIMARSGREPAFDAALRYAIVERSPALTARQRATLAQADMDGRVTWLDDLPASAEGMVVSNEFFDALPVHRVRREAGELREVYVTHDGRRFTEVLGPPSTPDIAAYFGALGVLLGDGCFAEANLEAPRWIGRIAGALRSGAVLTFDYGYAATELYAPWRRDGTLLCFYRQSVSSDPYARVGKQDITSSVDFTTLRAAGEAHGLVSAGIASQTEFLERLGIGEGVAAAAGEGANLEEYFARRRVVMDLIDPGRLGRIRVLLQTKGTLTTPLTGFVEGVAGEATEETTRRVE
jgi:SAM-dependent MidA family methyltransferase